MYFEDPLTKLNYNNPGLETNLNKCQLSLHKEDLFHICKGHISHWLVDQAPEGESVGSATESHPHILKKYIYQGKRNTYQLPAMSDTVLIL